MRLLTMNEAAAVPLETLLPPKPIRSPAPAGAGVSVSQSVTLFPHMTLVSSNMCDGRRRGERRGEGDGRADGELLSLHLFSSLEMRPPSVHSCLSPSLALSHFFLSLCPEIPREE